MYNIEIPAPIHFIIAVFYQLRLWTKDNESTFHERGRKLFCFLYFVSFMISIALGAHLTNDEDERIFLIVTLMSGVVLIYKLWFILWKQNVIFELVHEIGTVKCVDRQEFIQVNKKLKFLMKFVQYFVFFVFSTLIVTVILFPLANEKRLFLNIAFPLNRSESEISLWMAFVFAAIGTFGAIVAALFTPLLWYLLHSFVLKYEVLGNQFRKIGTHATGSQPEVSIAKRQKLYVKDLVAAIQIHDGTNGKFEEFTSIFSNLFFLQIVTSSICICGSVYSLAFSSHENFVQDGIYCKLLFYSFFDVFIIMYLANDIAWFSGKLSYCIFESNWMEQTQSCKNNILILGERLKQSQEIIVGKIYRLNLVTFNSIVNSAYSMFNILQNLRK